MNASSGDRDLLPVVVRTAEAAAGSLLERYDPDVRPADRAAMFDVGMTLQSTVEDAAREALSGLLPGARWFDEDVHGRADLSTGEWWLVDGIEGAVNYVHGLPEWAVLISLVRDGLPALTVAREPLPDRTWTAVRGAGSHLNGRALQASAKTDLSLAMVTASQAGNGPEIHARFGHAMAGMMDAALLVRNTVPTVFPLLTLAAGQHDAFWQYDPDLPGSLTGTLLAGEAGAIVTDLTGGPWSTASADLLVAAPGLHAAALEILRRYPA